MQRTNAADWPAALMTYLPATGSPPNGMEQSHRCERADAELEAAIERLLAARAQRTLSERKVWRRLMARLARH
jgi:hypothetical protein